MNNTKQTRKKTWQFFRLMLISGSIFLLSCIIIIILIGWQQQDKIKEVFAKNLGEQFGAELHIANMRLSLLKSFPLATVTLSGVSLNDKSNASTQAKLLEAESIRLQFDITDLLKKEYTVIQLVISNGRFAPVVSENGERNFQFNLPANGNKPQQMQFNIRRLLLRNMEIDFTNQQKGRHLLAVAKNLRLGGQFNGKQTLVAASGDLHIHNFFFQESLVTNTGIGLEASLEIDRNGQWIVHEGNIKYDGKHFEISGMLDARSDKMLLTRAKVRAKDLQIGSVMSLLPQAAKQAIMPFEPNGTLSFDASLDGLIGNGHIPRINSSFSIKNASCTMADHDIRLENIDLQATYTNGNDRAPESSQLRISHFKAQTSGNTSKLKGHLNITNFLTQHLSFHLIAETTAEELAKTANVQNIVQAGGRVKLDITFAGKRNADRGFDSKELMQAQLAGSVEFADLDFFINHNKNLRYHQLNGKMHFNNNKLIAENISGKAGKSTFVLTGTADNLLPYLFLPGEHLFVDADLQSSLIMLDELLYRSESTSEAEAYGFKLPKRLQMTITADIDHLEFRRFHAENIKGTARLKGQQIHAGQLSFNTMDGQVMMTGAIDAKAQNSIRLNTEARLQDVNINQLFYQTGNFGQTTIVDNNIHGSVTADMFFSATWSEHLKIDWESMETNAQLRIEDGRLLNFEPMIALGRFIRTDELDDVSFSTIENHIQIKNRIISIPMMEVSSNVLNLQMQGEHSFDNEIEYRLRVLLSDLLARQHRERRNPQEHFGEIIDDGLGRTTLFLRLSGTTFDPVLSYDQQGVREKLREDIRDERQNLRNILREEFSFMSRQREDSLETKGNTRQAERQLIRKQEEEGFIIEWD